MHKNINVRETWDLQTKLNLWQPAWPSLIPLLPLLYKVHLVSRDRSSEYLHLQWIRTKEVQSGKPPEKTTLRHFVLGEKWVCAAPLTIYITLSTSVRKKKKKSVHIEVLFVRVGYYWSFLLIKGKRRNVFEQQHVMECSHWEQLVSTDSTAQFGTRHAKKTKCRCVGVSSIPASKPKSCTGVLFGNFQTPFVNVNAFKSRSHWLFFKSTKPETCLKGPIHFCYKTFSSV